VHLLGFSKNTFEGGMVLLLVCDPTDDGFQISYADRKVLSADVEPFLFGFSGRQRNPTQFDALQVEVLAKSFSSVTKIVIRRYMANQLLDLWSIGIDPYFFQKGMKFLTN
jgi:hypothetical protein